MSQPYAADDIQYCNPVMESYPMQMQPRPGAIIGQSAAARFIQAQPPIPGIPLGLEYLTQLDQLLVHQLEHGRWEPCNKYQIKNSIDMQVFFAEEEESDVCMRQYCDKAHAFTIRITDNFAREVMRVQRDFKCCAGCNCCAGYNHNAMEVRVEAPVGQTIGYVKQQKSCLASKYAVLDANMEKVLKIQGPVCVCHGVCSSGEVDFMISTFEADHQIGIINKQWSEMWKPSFTDADNYSVNFPVDLDVRCKATILGATFLIDLMHFGIKTKDIDVN